MSSLRFRFAIVPVILAASALAQASDAPAKKAAPLPVSAPDLHIKKNISVNGYLASSVDISLKGARERTANGTSVTVRQCDLKRTLTLNEEAQTYMVTNDPRDTEAARAAALATGAQVPDSDGGITVTTTITDTGERKTMFGYPARHLKASIVEESSAKACSQVHEKYELDGWYADIAKEQAGCAHFVPPVRQGDNCHDAVISKRIGSGKPGYPMIETITMHNADASATTVTTQTEELSKQENLPDELFDIPPGYHQVGSVADLRGAAQPLQQGSPNPQAAAPPTTTTASAQPASQPTPDPPAKKKHFNPFSALNPASAMAAQGGAMAQAQQAAAMGGNAAAAGGMATGMASMLGSMGGAPGMGGMAGMGTKQPPAGTNVAAPQALGPKAVGKIRVGVAPPDAQLGQGNNAGADYSTPIRNVIVALMSGPAVEIAALDSHVVMQLQAEAQQKQCDYILYSSVAVKHSSAGGFGKFMKMAAPVANMTPMGMMAHGMGSAMAMSAASAAASAAAQQAQQQAISQLAGFNGQVKSKDDVTVQYQLVQTGQTAPVVQNALQGKAKSDGEDVLTPLLQDTANTVLTTVSKK
jgi:hypothetical protein